jgi:hypothetical protein
MVAIETSFASNDCIALFSRFIGYKAINENKKGAVSAP